MVQFKGTKGKWLIDDASNLETEIVSETHRIAQAKHFNKQIDDKLLEPTPEEGLANALLISKAPEMLEALIECERTLREVFKWNTANLQQLLTEATKID